MMGLKAEEMFASQLSPDHVSQTCCGSTGSGRLSSPTERVTTGELTLCLVFQRSGHLDMLDTTSAIINCDQSGTLMVVIRVGDLNI